ncbi:hypothetical protein MIR68_002343 [Amoeboaphelidium protococcarum]|nr:hypothetical protein MIR68_002343 [Amoeboaphelidium protococcarum]
MLKWDTIIEINAPLDLDQQNFFSRVDFSPDGQCRLSNAEDGIVRIYRLIDQSIERVYESHVVEIRGESAVYDYDWFPLMDNSVPETCCFIACSNRLPVRLYDASGGYLRASYSTYNQYDELVGPLRVKFNSAGDNIIAGYENHIRLLDLQRPGKYGPEDGVIKLTENRKCQDGVKGLVSSIDVSSNLCAIGTFHNQPSQSNLGLLDLVSQQLITCFKGSSSGINQVKFSKSTPQIYVSYRNSTDIKVFDTRWTDDALHQLQRDVVTTQRLFMDIQVDPFTGSESLLYGDESGALTQSTFQNDEAQQLQSVALHKSNLSCVSVNPQDQRMIATCSGSRIFEQELDICGGSIEPRSHSCIKIIRI